MFCYFLNCRKIVSKAGKEFFILTVATQDGDVSEFFVSENLYNSLSSVVLPFDYVNLMVNVQRGRVTVTSVEPALDPLSLKGGDLNA